MSVDHYDADYFLRGQELGISGYTDYRWMPDLTIRMAAKIVGHCGISFDHDILDFGCARGYAVRALREMGYSAWGHDISRWALENADLVAKEYLIADGSTLYKDSFDWVVAKDVLEHVEDIGETIDLIMGAARVGVFAVVPLSRDGCEYDVPEYENDVTHMHRQPLQWWVGHMHRPGWSVEARYRVPGVKDNYAHHPTGNGFITARRIEA